MSNPRFNKANVTETIKRHIAVESEDYGFDIRKGWEQVHAAAHRKAGPLRGISADQLHEAHRAFGAFEALHALAEELGLPCCEPASLRDEGTEPETIHGKTHKDRSC